ncbi:hypothetical protein CLV49_3643 [Labedella gwakjiensis]|uniref:Uncharacterized protein n=1 Tax=Labedella gwakjiensis TaxID=390269 RepID=A0A2P8H1A3_9MICO|nr:hypothetical protein [Labedella gwakjiensis]PSL39988.1 hypothetical protein CLV49_3643 [Labedella gwakjiensis]RUQ85659.1 hypothetical protein ELQ93_01055 [Labedella gwakjiensis]
MVADNNPPQRPEDGAPGSAPQWGPPPIGQQQPQNAAQGNTGQNNTGAYQPQQNAPQGNTGAYQPQQNAPQGNTGHNNTGAYQPQQNAPQGNTGAYQPQQNAPQGNTGAYQPQQNAPQGNTGHNNTGAYQPQQNAPQGNTGAYQPQNPGGYPAGGGYGATPPGGPGGPGKPSNPNKKKIILFSALAGGLVLLLIIGAVVINVVNSSVYGPDATVRSYLTAISKGDASEANKIAAPGVSEEQAVLLTDDVLGEAGEFITNAKVTQSRVSGDQATVRVSYSLGGTTYDGYIELSKAGKQGVFFDSWKIDTPLVGDLAVYISNSNSEANEAAVNGVTVAFGDEYSLPAYPALYTVGAPGSDFFTAEDVEYAVGTGTRADYEGVELELAPTEALTSAAQEAVNAYLDECATSTELDPEGCSLRLSWYTDFTSVDKVAYTIDDYPTVEVDEYGTYFTADGGSYTADVTGTTYDGTKDTLPFGLDGDWGITGKLVIDGDTITIEDVY